MTTRVVDIDNEIKNIIDFSNQKVIIPRHSGRIRRALDRYEANIIVPDTNDEDPRSYEEAMMDSDKENWHEAMNKEMESMYSNFVWELVVKDSGQLEINGSIRGKRDLMEKSKSIRLDLLRKATYRKRE